MCSPVGRSTRATRNRAGSPGSTGQRKRSPRGSERPIPKSDWVYWSLRCGKRSKRPACCWRTPPQASTCRQLVNDFTAALHFRSSPDEVDMKIDSMALTPYARWITPKMESRRFDTRFYIAVVPEDQTASHDGTETTSATWLRPAGAIEDMIAGRIKLAPPTVRTLDWLSQFDDAKSVIADALSRKPPLVRPRLVTGKDGWFLAPAGGPGTPRERRSIAGRDANGVRQRRLARRALACSLGYSFSRFFGLSLVSAGTEPLPKRDGGQRPEVRGSLHGIADRALLPGRSEDNPQLGGSRSDSALPNARTPSPFSTPTRPRFPAQVRLPDPRGARSRAPARRAVRRWHAGQGPGSIHVANRIRSCGLPRSANGLTPDRRATPGRRRARREGRPLSGAEIIEALKRGNNTQHVRAVLLAGGEADKQAALAAGASAHVSPTDLTGLRDTLEALMGIRH